MNISGLIRSLVGDLTAADSKTLELKVGQIVKGVVLQLLSDQEAMLNIGGVQVRAKLETPLKQGDVTMLQVQPESNGGQILLKPLMNSNVQISEDSLGDLLQDFEVKDSLTTRNMVQTMQKESVPVTKENVRAFEQVMQAVPEGESKEAWLEAAVLAAKKNLPVTPATVAALKQVISGPPAGQVLDQLEQQASALIEAQPDHPAAEIAKQVVSVLKELRTASAAVEGVAPRGHGGAAEGVVTPPAAQEEADGLAPLLRTRGSGEAAPVPQAAPGSSAPAGGAAVLTPAASPAGEAVPAAATPPQEGAPAAMAKPAAESQAATAQRAATPEPAPARSAEPLPQGEPRAAGSPEMGTPPAKREAAAQAEARGQAPHTQLADPPEGNWINRLLKAVGVEHENHLAAKLDDRLTARQPDKNGVDLNANALVAPASDQPNEAVKPAAAETLKSLLLQLTASDDTPAPLKETAQQALGQITGQQLMLTNDKTAMFTQITLFIPFVNGSGEQSAAIHIQSRKGSRGQVDANNCRLLFDLQMKAMGNTLLDVAVVNKIVSLTIHNDHPAIGALMETSKKEISEALNRVGYQFISLKCSPYPKPVAAEAAPGDGDLAGRADLKSLYQPLTYKGVDVRA